MKKLWLLPIGACLLAAVSAQAEISRQDILNKIASNYQNVQEFSGEIEIGMSMMGTTMKTPCQFWQKGKQFRMNTLVQQPGMPQPMEQNMLFDEKGLTIYQKTLNTVMTVDFARLPAEMRDQIKKQQTFFDPNNMTREIGKILDDTDLSEKSRDGRKFYVFDIKDLKKVAQNVPANLRQQAALFKRMMVWVDQANYFPSRIEFYADAEQPGMWMDIKNFKAGPVNASLFTLDIPKDAKTMDMTDMLVNMSKQMKKGDSTAAETGKK